MEAAYERIEKEYENLLREKERQEGVEKSALVQMEMHLKRYTNFARVNGNIH